MADKDEDFSIAPDEDLDPVNPGKPEHGAGDSDESVVVEEYQGDVVKKLREKLKACEAKAREHLDGWQRAQADFANLRRRDEESKQEVIRYAGEKVIRDLVPVLDSCTQAVSGGHKDVEPILRQIMQTLGQYGLEEINPEGEQFDPNFHEAVGFVPVDNEKDDHKILEIMQKGYKLHEKVLRPARVMIGKFNE